MSVRTSLLNDGVSIDEEYWAVTMICNSLSSGEPATSSFGNNHALLAVEGVEKSGEVFHKYIHLRGPAAFRQTNSRRDEEFRKNKAPFIGIGCVYGMQRIGQVEAKDIRDNYKYTHKSDTWLRSADKVRAMLHQVEEEQNHPAEFPRPFSILGNRSVFSADLKTFKITDPLILAIAHCDRKLFLKLYDRVKKCRDGNTPGIERLNQPYFYPLEDMYQVMDASLMPKGPEGGYNIVARAVSAQFSDYLRPRTFAEEFFKLDTPSTWRSLFSFDRRCEIVDLFESSETVEDRERLVEKAPQHEKEFFTLAKENVEKSLGSYKQRVLCRYGKRVNDLVDKIISNYPQLEERVSALRDEFNESPISTSCQLLLIIYNSTDLRALTPDSCFTWAREKLGFIDVEVENKGFEAIVSPTKCYLNPIQERNWSCISCCSKGHKNEAPNS